MGEFAAIIVVVIGIALLVMGIQQTSSFQSEVSDFVTGDFSKKAIWFLIMGTLLTIIGIVPMLKNRAS